MTKFQDRFKVKSARLVNWDYKGQADYFVTICVKDKECVFGEIHKGIMNLSETGKIVQAEWLKTVAIRKDMNLSLGVFIVMPNHIHGIITIGQNPYNYKYSVSKFGPQSKNLASIIRGFKTSVVIQVRRYIDPYFKWQPNYYDHIINSEYSYQMITNYINENPARWEEEKWKI